MKYSHTTGVFERPRTPTARLGTGTGTIHNGRSDVSSPSPLKKYSYRPADKSQSPTRLVTRLSSAVDPQKDYLDLLKEERELRQRIKLAQQENETLVKTRMKSASDLNTRRSKFDEEKNQIVDLFADFVAKRNVLVEFPRPRSPLSNSIRMLGSRREKSEVSASRSGMNSSTMRALDELSTDDKSVKNAQEAQEECNFLVKYLLKESYQSQIPSNLRALNRGVNLNS